MTTREFGANLGIIVVAMGLLAVAERLVPLFGRGARSRERSPANLGLGALTLLVNWALSSASAALAVRLSLEGRGLLPGLALPAPAPVGVGIVALDLCTYLAHRSMHAIPLLWRAHRIHHSDGFVDVGTTLRQHPIEGVWRFLWIAAPVWALGLPPGGVVVYRLVSVLQAMLEHANVRVWGPLERALSVLVCTPNMHKIHHSRERLQNDSNYGNILALFDRSLGTFRAGDGAFGVVYGVDDVASRRANSLSTLLTLPFESAR